MKIRSLQLGVTSSENIQQNFPIKINSFLTKPQKAKSIKVIENPDRKYFLPRLIKQQDHKLVPCSNREKTTLDYSDSSLKKKKSLMSDMKIDMQIEKKQLINQKQFRDDEIRTSQDLFNNELLRQKILKQKLQHYRKFSYDRVFKTQMAPEKNYEVKKIRQHKLRKSLNQTILNRTQLKTEPNEEEHEIFLNPAFWKNKQFSKIIQNRLKILLHHKQSHRKEQNRISQIQQD